MFPRRFSEEAGLLFVFWEKDMKTACWFLCGDTSGRCEVCEPLLLEGQILREKCKVRHTKIRKKKKAD